jgi:hypothetical protein
MGFVQRAGGSLNDLFKKRVRLERLYRKEKRDLLDALEAKYQPLREEIKRACEAAGHDWQERKFVMYCAPCDSVKDLEKKEPHLRLVAKACPGCCYSDGMEYESDGSWTCHRCGDKGEP